MIIPTLNEAERIAQAIAAARGAGECEIIVADGGSADGTLQQAASADRVLTTDPGRALQQNAGAVASTGDVLLFLHADCLLPTGAFDAIRTALDDKGCIGGCFRQAIDAPGLAYRILEWGNAQRVRWLGWAYGDQGIFVRRDVFNRLGGFPEIPLMEDLYFMKRVRREGRIALIEPRLRVSARRWQAHGIVRQTLRNWTLLALAHCGVSPSRLSRFYPHVRDDRERDR